MRLPRPPRSSLSSITVRTKRKKGYSGLIGSLVLEATPKTNNASIVDALRSLVVFSKLLLHACIDATKGGGRSWQAISNKKIIIALQFSNGRSDVNLRANGVYQLYLTCHE